MLHAGVGIYSDKDIKELNVYPSVTSDFLNIRMNNLKSVEIFDVTGKSVASDNASSDNIRYDVSSLTNGIYILKASNGTSNVVEKFIKK